MKKPSNLKLKENAPKKRSKTVSCDFQTRRKQYLELKHLRQMLKEKKLKASENAKNERVRIEEKKKRKEMNQLKCGKYEIIKNPAKIKKWKRKARQMLQNIPPDIFYEHSQKK